MAETVFDRIALILKMNGWKYEAALLRAADLPKNTITRQRTREGGFSTDTLERMARAGGVDLEWLQTGKGSASPKLADLPADPRYPSRPIALRAAELEGVGPAVIRKVRAINHFDRDPGPFRWMDIIRGHHEATPPKVRSKSPK